MEPYILIRPSVAIPLTGAWAAGPTLQGCFGRPSISRGSTTSGSSGTKALTNFLCIHGCISQEKEPMASWVLQGLESSLLHKFSPLYFIFDRCRS